MGRDIKGFMLQPVGPEALGWFQNQLKIWLTLENINSELLTQIGSKLTKT